MRCPGRIVDRGHGTRESVHDGDRDGHVTEARAGESRERAPRGPQGRPMQEEKEGVLPER